MSQPKLRMNRSLDFSTIHGERAPGDPHAGVHFYQDGLPFDAQGILIDDHPEMQGDSKQAVKNRATAERKLKKQAKSKPVADEANADAPAADDDDNEADAPADEAEPISIKAWAKGEQKVEWQLISNAIALKFSKRPSSKKAAIEFLVEERYVTKNELSDEHQKLLPSSVD